MNSKISDYILYYPSIEFQSMDWVKSSLLLWDNVYRIVPKGYEPNDNDEIRAFVDAGLIRNIMPTDEEKKGFKKRAERTYRQMDSSNYRPAGLQSTGYARIHKDKIDSRLYPFLEEVSKDIDFNSGEWIKTPDSFAKFYMFVLSKIIAESRNMNQGTDNPDKWTIGQYFSNKGNFGDYVKNPSAKSYLCSLVLDDLIPQDIGAISVKDIIDFSKQRHDERVMFRTRIDGLMNKMSQVKSQEQAYDIEKDFVNQVEQDKERLKESMSFAHHQGVGKSIMTGINLSFGAMSALGWSGTPFTLQHLSATILFGAVGAFLNHRKVKQESNPSDISMLVGIDSLKRTLPINIGCMSSLDAFVND